MVGEYALGHRISLFDLDGNFVKLLKTKHSVFYPTALRDGKVAYIGITHSEQDRQRPVQIQTVYIKDIDTQVENRNRNKKSMLQKIIKYLQQPYPNDTDIKRQCKIILGVGLFVVVFINYSI